MMNREALARELEKTKRSIERQKSEFDQDYRALKKCIEACQRSYKNTTDRRGQGTCDHLASVIVSRQKAIARREKEIEDHKRVIQKFGEDADAILRRVEGNIRGAGIDLIPLGRATRRIRSAGRGALKASEKARAVREAADSLVQVFIDLGDVVSGNRQVTNALKLYESRVRSFNRGIREIERSIEREERMKEQDFAAFDRAGCRRNAYNLRENA